MKRNRSCLLLANWRLLLFVLLTWHLPAWFAPNWTWPVCRAAEVEARLSRDQGYVGVPMQLEVRIENAEDYQQPTLPEVEGLRIASQGAAQTSSQITIINGYRTERKTVTLVYRVTPMQEGSFIIPAFEVEVDGRRRKTQPLQFEVVQSETGDLLHVEIVGPDKPVFVGQVIPLRLKIEVKPFRSERFEVTLSEADMWNLIFDEPSNWGAFEDRMRDLKANRKRPGGKEVLRKDATGNQRTYYSYELTTEIYPKKPGLFSSAPTQVVVSYPTRLTRSRSFFSLGSSLEIADTRPIVAQAELPAIEVKPVPTQGQPEDYRGAVGSYRIVTSAAPTKVQAGDAITLHIGVLGDGPMDLVQAPPLGQLSQITDRFYVIDESLAGIVEDDLKQFTTTIRPKTADVDEIPPIPFSYFDPDAEQYVTVTSKPIAIEVSAAEQLDLKSLASADTSDDAQPPAEARPRVANSDSETPEADFEIHRQLRQRSLLASAPRWLWLSLLALPPLGFFVAWAGLCIAGNNRLRIFPSGISRSFLRKRIQQANSAEEVRQALLDGLRYLLSTDQPPSGLDDALLLARSCGEAIAADHLESFLRNYEGTVYSGLQPNLQNLRQDALDCFEALNR